MQADELRIQAANFADALSSRGTAKGLEQPVRVKAREAAKISSTLGELHAHPESPHVARRVERLLTRIGRCGA